MLTRLQEFAARIGLTGLAIAILVALLAVQTVRLEGMKLWPLSIQGWKARALSAEKTVREIDEAQDAALIAAQDAKERVEREYKELAERTDDDAEKAREGALADAERFIADNRVRCPANRGASGGVPAATGDNGARGSDGPGDTPIVDGPGGDLSADADLVAVRADDVRVCTTNTIRLEAGRKWALELAD